MANHKSAKKRIRQAEAKRVHNRYYAVTARNAVRAFVASEDAEEVKEKLPKVTAMLDKLAKINVIHKNKAANIKARISKHAKTVLA